jgi:hypothetical protein
VNRIRGDGLTVMALAPHSVANLGMSLWALGFPLATPVRCSSASATHNRVVGGERGRNGRKTYEFNGQWDCH